MKPLKLSFLVNSTPLLALLASSLMALLPACEFSTSSEAPGASGQADASPLRSGSFAFRFDPNAIEELEIFQHTPDSGAPYSARFKRGPDERGTPHWEIISTDRPMIDRLADSSFVAHLVDTLATLQIAKAPPQAPRGPLSSFGLHQPRLALRWKGGGHTYEVRLGAEVPKENSAYAYFPGLDRFGLSGASSGSTSDGHPPVYVVKGSALEMLDRVRSFDSLRLRNLSPLRTDEIASVELKRGGKPAFQARRGGPGWKSDWMDRITHMKIQSFIDDEKKASPLRQRVVSQPAFEIVLQPGKGEPVRIWVALLDGKAVAAVSSRPKAAFILNPMALRYFESP